MISNWIQLGNDLIIIQNNILVLKNFVIYSIHIYTILVLKKYNNKLNIM